MEKLKIMVVFGTRPEAIKMAPLVLELQKQKEVIETITVVTAQHRQMLDQVLETFNIVPDYDLDIMGKSQTLLDITSKILNQLDPVIKKEKPVWCSSMEIQQPPLRRVWLPFTIKSALVTSKLV